MTSRTDGVAHPLLRHGMAPCSEPPQTTLDLIAVGNRQASTSTTTAGRRSAGRLRGRRRRELHDLGLLVENGDRDGAVPVGTGTELRGEG
jgi:hypothetical protein